MTPSRQIVLALAGTTATVLLYFAAGMLGPAAVFFNLVIPIPAIWLQVAGGPLVGAAIVLATTAVVGATSGIQAAMWYLLAFGIGSFVLPWLLLRQWSWDRAVGLSLAAVLLAASLLIAAQALETGQLPLQGIEEAIRTEIDKAVTVYRQADLPLEQIQELESMAPAVTAFLVKSWPGLAAVAAGFLLLLQVALLKTFSAIRQALPGPAFHHWKAPEGLIWGLILAGFGALFGEGWLQTAALNLLMIVVPVYFLQGLAVITFFFRKKGLSTFFRILAYVLITVLNPFPLIVTGIGVFDLWADFRKPRIKQDES